MYFLIVIGICTFATTDLAQGSCSGGFKNDQSDCNAYFECANGDWIKEHCPPNLEWNQNGFCDWPGNSGCTTGGSAPAPAPIETEEPASGASGQSGGVISQSEFQCAAKTKDGNPDSSYYNGFINSLPKADISTKAEAAKFLAHAIWETVGFQFTKEVACQSRDCSDSYPNSQGGLPGKVYYGRGMLQITWDYNYKAASQALYGDDRLIQNPDQVANDPAIGWATAAWFWKTNVHPRADTFGKTLKAINGALECEGGSAGQNRVLRFNHYKNVLACLNIPAPPDSDGACSAWS